MFDHIRKAFRLGKTQPLARLPKGQRVYAIGDIHGRHDLFDALIRAIEADDAPHNASAGADHNAPSSNANTTVILLGDLIDRGPDSAGVIKLARLWSEHRAIRFLTGNHEEMLLDAFESVTIMRHFLKHGGRETILSYGVTVKQFNNASTEELQQAMRKLIPESDRVFIKGFEEMIEIGDYLFVHAGINPEKPLSDQRKRDTRWIRDPFLNSTKKHSHMIIHGHTIVKHIDKRDNRIGIDTGAYRHGVLTAMVLEGTTQRYIQAIETESGKIVTQKKESAE